MNQSNKWKPIYLGQTLINRGFRDWFLYMFSIIEANKFIIQPAHTELFQVFTSVESLQTKRANINIMPRSAKTTMATYFVVYCLTKNPKSEFIYTSYSQKLLSAISANVKKIFESNIYKAMYDNISTNLIEYEENPLDNFWQEYLEDDEENRVKKNTYSAGKITTKQGGCVLFSSVGSAITGFGAGKLSAEGFSGGLIIDDANKPADVQSELMREKVFSYYTDTLLSRLNNGNAGVINIQQRLHKYDLTGYLIERYSNLGELSYKNTVIPLLIDGVCQLPAQYSPERIQELQTDNFTFETQYQQNPLTNSDTLFKLTNSNYVDPLIIQDLSYDYTILSIDCASSSSASADNTAFVYMGYKDGVFYVIDILKGKWEYKDIEEQFRFFYTKCNQTAEVVIVAIEGASSGTSLYSRLRNGDIKDLKTGNPIQVITHKFNATTSKQSRVQLATKTVGFIEMGFKLPTHADWLLDYVAELTGFPYAKNDDLVDATTQGIIVMKEMVEGKKLH
jgi:predicted phage terminase large subunit-like protein